MDTRTNLYRIVSVAAMVLAFGAIITFALSQYRVTWCLIAALIICAEARVQLKGRLPRTRLIFVHLSAAIPFFIALTVLAFFIQNMVLEILTALLGIAVLVTGTMLWQRGMHAHTGTKTNNLP